LTGDSYKKHYENGFSNQFCEASNHKVIKIEESVEQEVFDISVPEYHNFAANDVIVHNCWHPDVIEFIHAKQTQGRLTKFNISVGVTDAFMTAVENDADWELIFPDVQFGKYDTEWDGDIRAWIRKGYPVKVYEKRRAREIWDMIMKATYNRNEPGIFFIDSANHFNNLAYCEKLVATNPCGEQPLPDGGICLLGSINLVHFINDQRTGWDYDRLGESMRVQVRMMDNVNDITYAALPIQKKNLTDKRRIGIGVLGYGSALMLLNARYGSQKALRLTNDLMKFFTNEAYKASSMIALEKGSFDLFDAEKYLQSEFVKKALSDETKGLIRKNGLRNSHIISIAPTGNTSIYAGIVSGGLEPVFMLEYDR